ncbi:MAG TPA: YceI family protein [Myxococcales bacterium]|jgi:polyisoprenoid-binding protein YceI
MTSLLVPSPSFRAVGLIFFCAGAAVAAPRTYAVDESQSSARAHVGKTGIASFAGHEHVILAQRMQGEIVFDGERFGNSSVEVTVDARSLKVQEKGEPEGDAPKVQEAMRGKGQLDVAQYTAVRFRSTNVIGRQTGANTCELSVAGELTLHGAKRLLTVPIQLELRGDQLIATGKLTVKLTDFGVEPTSAAGGLVKVENDVPIDFRFVGHAR